MNNKLSFSRRRKTQKLKQQGEIAKGRNARIILQNGKQNKHIFIQHYLYITVKFFRKAIANLARIQDKERNSLSDTTIHIFIYASSIQGQTRHHLEN